MYFSILLLAYLPFSLPIERRIQNEIELGVRKQVGLFLNESGAEGQTAVFEPLGYIGYFSENKHILDFPGLNSKIVTDFFATKSFQDRNLISLIEGLDPDWIVLRDFEYDNFKNSASFDKYNLIKTFDCSSYCVLGNSQYNYGTVDDVFYIFNYR